ncbi:hypothetical protein BDW68DRAFT_157472 [Aspergillus falconensis]
MNPRNTPTLSANGRISWIWRKVPLSRALVSKSTWADAWQLQKRTKSVECALGLSRTIAI